MAINWTSPNIQFGHLFEGLDAAQMAQFEDHPELAWQRLMGAYSGGDPNFANTTFGRYLQSRMGAFQNEYLMRAGQQTADWANQKQQWEANQAGNLERWQSDTSHAKTDYEMAQKAYEDAAHAAGYWTGVPTGQLEAEAARARDAYSSWQNLQNNPYQKQDWKSPEEQLTWTRFLDSNPDMSHLGSLFGQLTSSQRGANPGAFQVRRNLW